LQERRDSIDNDLPYKYLGASSAGKIGHRRRAVWLISGGEQ
jgi:hypothetical protein